MISKVILHTLTIGMLLSLSCASIPKEKILTHGSEVDSLFVSDYEFVNTETPIYDPHHTLSSFYDVIGDIDSLGAVASIVHFGDSHIQGGVLSQTIMRRFARDYGSAGRGFISAHKLSGKNEPRDYSFTSSSKPVKSSTIASWKSDIKAGISGVAVQSLPGNSYTVKVLALEKDTLNYECNRMVVYHDSLAPIITLKDKKLLDRDKNSNIFNSFSTEINLKEPTHTAILRTYAEGEFRSGALYGIALENGRGGVIYHSLGINGACYLHWGKHPQIATQCSALDPRLIIISLGSNEAAGSNFIESVFIREVDSFVSKLQSANPGVPILLTTPPEAMRRRNSAQVPNSNFVMVDNALREYVETKGIALYNLYQATSGSGSANKWRKNSMLAKDGVHYMNEGYKLQGLLIYNALKREINRHSN